jgi:hypothetical protein
MVHRGQARTLSGMVEPSQLVIAQCEVPVAPFHSGAGALEDLRELGRLCFALVLLHHAERAEAPPGANSGVRRRSARARSGGPSVLVRVEATRSREKEGMSWACTA